MKSIHRNIVGAFIFSNDGYILLGMNQSGGVYDGEWTIPGGGVEAFENNLQALEREIAEEVGIDISEGIIEQLGSKNGESLATSKDTGERILIKMSFNDYKVTLPKAANDIKLTSGDDFSSARWFMVDEIINLKIAAPAKKTLQLLISNHI
jgi:nucleoside triphosphatase